MSRLGKKGRLIIIVLAGIALGAAATATALFLDSKVVLEARRFTKGKEAIAKKLYTGIMEKDLENAYPTSPEGVMDFYNDAFYMIYSNMIVHDGTLLEVLLRQREVYSEALKSLNPENIQFANLKNSLKELYADNNICLSVERKGTVYDETAPGECVVQVMIYYNTFGSLYRNYYLVQDPQDGRWKINAWRMTDENYQ